MCVSVRGKLLKQHENINKHSMCIRALCDDCHYKFHIHTAAATTTTNSQNIKMTDCFIEYLAFIQNLFSAMCSVLLFHILTDSITYLNKSHGLR